MEHAGQEQAGRGIVVPVPRTVPAGIIIVLMGNAVQAARGIRVVVLMIVPAAITIVLMGNAVQAGRGIRVVLPMIVPTGITSAILVLTNAVTAGRGIVVVVPQTVIHQEDSPFAIPIFTKNAVTVGGNRVRFPQTVPANIPFVIPVTTHASPADRGISVGFPGTVPTDILVIHLMVGNAVLSAGRGIVVGAQETVPVSITIVFGMYAVHRWRGSGVIAPMIVLTDILVIHLLGNACLQLGMGMVVVVPQIVPANSPSVIPIL